MNIFRVHDDAVISAQSLVDSHVNKMILESAQLLSTAHRVLDGTQTVIVRNGRKVKAWVLPDARQNILYSATHSNHPSAKWIRESDANYTWLALHYVALGEEYTYRYGKIHKSMSLLPVLQNCPNNIAKTSILTNMIPAMDPKYVVSQNVVENYRNYYRTGKTHLFRWTKRNPPEWISLDTPRQV